MPVLNVREARTQPSRLMAEVEAGEEVSLPGEASRTRCNP